MAKHHTVSISDNRGRVRLRWTYRGQRYSLNLGIPYTPTYLKVASMTAHRIELDIERETLMKPSTSTDSNIYDPIPIRRR